MATKKRLGDLLIEAKLISESDLENALRLQVGGSRRLGYLLIKMGIITEEQLHGVLSQQLDLPIANIDEEFSPEVKRILPRYLCHKYSTIPLVFGENNTLKAAMVDPSDDDAVSDIEKYTGKVIRPVLAPKSAITSAIRSKIPWSLNDLFNAQNSGKITAAVAAVALALVVITSVQFYQDQKKEKYGKVTVTPASTTYENLELIVGFDEENGVSLLGRGAHSSGYYSVTFSNIDGLEKFLVTKKDGFSARQLEWLEWAKKNPLGSK